MQRSLTKRSISERDNINVAMLLLPWRSRYSNRVVSSLSRRLNKEYIIITKHFDVTTLCLRWAVTEVVIMQYCTVMVSNNTH